jgi:hypothetical protein
LDIAFGTVDLALVVEANVGITGAINYEFYYLFKVMSEIISFVFSFGIIGCFYLMLCKFNTACSLFV